MIYLDNAATEPVFGAVSDRMYEILKNEFGNPSSLHNMGMRAENIIEDAREEIADSIKARPDEIYFAPSGTMADNTAVLGYLRRNVHSGKQVMISSVEHPAVYNIIPVLKNMGYEVLEIPIKDFCLDYDFIERNLSANTALISCMAVNNETGTQFDIRKIKDIITKKNLKTVVHSDCVQAYMKTDIDIRSFGADMISLSAHKIGGPKGIGVFYMKKGLFAEPLYVGGGQERGLFSQTEAVHNIAGFGLAVKINRENDFVAHTKELSKLFYENLDPKITVNSKNSVSGIINISVGIRSEIALHMLEAKGIYVSSGSACSQKKGERSRALKNFGIPVKLQDTALRISIGYHNTKEDILSAVSAINKL